MHVELEKWICVDSVDHDESSKPCVGTTESCYT